MGGGGLFQRHHHHLGGLLPGGQRPLTLLPHHPPHVGSPGSDQPGALLPGLDRPCCPGDVFHLEDLQGGGIQPGHRGAGTQADLQAADSGPALPVDLLRTDARPHAPPDTSGRLQERNMAALSEQDQRRCLHPQPSHGSFPLLLHHHIGESKHQSDHSLL